MSKEQAVKILTTKVLGILDDFFACIKVGAHDFSNGPICLRCGARESKR
jgi:hypothetical protein